MTDILWTAFLIWLASAPAGLLFWACLIVGKRADEHWEHRE